MKKRKKAKARGVWKINPKTRVGKSKKTYSRPEEQRKIRRLGDKIGWFGEK